ncbi:MAG: type II secretion system protein M [Gammaproteobacteria bacterium]|nr:type II secretion system protein M [Gammaproteobacteria bacterium]
MIEFLSRYSARERMIVISGIVILFGIAIHAGLIEPYQQRLTTIKEDLAQSKTDLQWMASVKPRLAQHSGVVQIQKFDGSLANLINQAVNQQQLNSYLTQMTPRGEDEISVRFKDIPFQQMIVFIAKINEQGLKLKDLRINAGDNPAHVDSNLVLDKGL